MSKQEPELVIFIGIQASGKSMFYHQNFSKTHLRINLDMIWTRPKEKRLFESCMKMRQQAVIDNTNLLKVDRKRYIPIAKEHGMKVIGYYFQPNLDNSINRNDKREGKEKIPKCAVISAYNKIEAPSFEEGFDEIYLVVGDNGNFIEEEYIEDENQRIEALQARERIIYFDFSNMKYKGLFCCFLETYALKKKMNISFDMFFEMMMIQVVGESDLVLDSFVDRVLTEFRLSEKKNNELKILKTFEISEEYKNKILFEAKAFPNIIVQIREKSRWFGLKTEMLLILNGSKKDINRFEEFIDNLDA